ncbi:hypothetical protein [Sulfoacidibacillus ferrooxidans]|uniref:Type 4 fimbrial biogenesis protein PilX N-terminal domain-containing protein n=1 Tax=Sulfoacidibacillus ferrooxidans TaxID=2005001 RepID=A0A9X1VAA8_9BACL|nr:hypothetical protein [Sulfoacidibacillus ferrooxidans]MCI0183784.1 hypothetical protein [Sulfoacidibacillus ferrooxidans]
MIKNDMFLRKEEGSALISVLLFSAILSILISTVLIISLDSQNSFRSAHDQTQALYNARAGIADGEYQLRYIFHELNHGEYADLFNNLIVYLHSSAEDRSSPLVISRIQGKWNCTLTRIRVNFIGEKNMDIKGLLTSEGMDHGYSVTLETMVTEHIYINDKKIHIKMIETNPVILQNR